MLGIIELWNTHNFGIIQSTCSPIFHKMYMNMYNVHVYAYDVCISLNKTSSHIGINGTSSSLI